MYPVSIPQVDWIGLAPVLTVLVTGIVALIVEMLRPKHNNNAIVGVSLAGLAVAGWFVITAPAGSVRSFGGMVLADSLGAIIQLLLIAICFICFLFSEPYLRQKRIAFGEFYPLALWSTAGGMMMATTDNLLMLFMGLEVLSIALYCLAGISRGESKSEESAIKYFLLGAFASAFLLMGIAYLYGASGSILLPEINARMAVASSDTQGFFIFGAAMILVGLAFKMALVPFHNWTPDVYQGAPTNVTAFMAAASKTAAVASMIRLLQGMPQMNEFWLPILFWLAVLTMVIGNLIALVQKDVKRVLGYSSIANAGYILVALISHIQAPDKVSLQSVLFYLGAYAFTTIGIFAVISLTAKAGTDGSRFEDLNGLWKRSPFAAGILVLFVASLVGIPPTAGFFGKLLIFRDALAADQMQLALVLAVASVVSVAYYLRIVQAAFVDDQGVVKREFGTATAGFKLTVTLCAMGVVLMGVLVSPFMNVTGAVKTEPGDMIIGTDEQSDLRAQQAVSVAE